MQSHKQFKSGEEMKIYISGTGSDWDGRRYYAIHEKTWWGSKQIARWSYCPDGFEEMMKIVTALKNLGNLVLEN